jgi:hypothetical protein
MLGLAIAGEIAISRQSANSQGYTTMPFYGFDGEFRVRPRRGQRMSKAAYLAIFLFLSISLLFSEDTNGKVIAVNEMGTYSIAYVDPGKYSLISQSDDANGFEMDLEAGKTYYFIQETVIGAAFVTMRIHTLLSRNSPEVVMYLVDGAYLSDWKRLN